MGDKCILCILSSMDVCANDGRVNILRPTCRSRYMSDISDVMVRKNSIICAPLVRLAFILVRFIILNLNENRGLQDLSKGVPVLLATGGCCTST